MINNSQSPFKNFESWLLLLHIQKQSEVRTQIDKHFYLKKTR